jgi:hypothetical protein
MRRFSVFVFAGVILISLFGCGGGGSSVGPLSITFTSTPVTVPGGTNFVFSVTTQNDTLNRGVNFTLALNEPSNGDTTTPCTTACGALSGQTNTITANGPDTFTSMTTVNFAAPLLPPTPNSLILTATSVANSSVTITDTFEIGAPQVVVHITNKITNIAPGSEPVTLNAEVLFDATNAGVTWTLTARGAACSPACGALRSALPFSVIYTPPATLPAAPNNTPTITATSVTTATVSDFDDIRIQASTQPISVSITNPFAQINAGSSGVTIDAVVENDIADQGVTWSLNPSAQTGALSAQLPLRVIYTPPNTAPQPPNNTPTITATSVADPTKSNSFTFTIASAAAFQGAYAFIIRGHDDNGNTIAAAGSIIADGTGKITAGEMDIKASNDDFPETKVPVTGIYGTEQLDDESQKISITLSNVVVAHQSQVLSFVGDFPGTLDSSRAPATVLKSAPIARRAKITGHLGPWTIDGEITAQQLSAALITSFIAKDFEFQLRTEADVPAYESGNFFISEGGLVSRGSVTLSSGEIAPVDDEVSGGNMAAFDINGRSSLTLILSKSGDSRQYAAYAVSPMRLMLVDTTARDSARPPSAGDAQLPIARH